MMTTIIGGSGSGKSAIAEQIAQKSTFPVFYLATMKPYGEEAQLRIERHRTMRAKKGFQTIEQYTDIHSLIIPYHCTILLECISNLCANEMFLKGMIKEEIAKKVIHDVRVLKEKVTDLVIVTNEVFSDGISYEDSTISYIHALGRINQVLAEISDRVIEVYYGIPVMWKGEKKWS